jgi:hypothetical protein
MDTSHGKAKPCGETASLIKVVVDADQSIQAAHHFDARTAIP